MFTLGVLVGVYAVGGLAMLATFASDWRAVRVTREGAARLHIPYPVFLALTFAASPFLLIRSVTR